jgi:hypothetical protein
MNHKFQSDRRDVRCLLAGRLDLLRFINSSQIDHQNSEPGRRQLAWNDHIIPMK